MERVLILGASGGIGQALVEQFARLSAEISALSRSVDGLDITDEASVEAHLGRLAGPFDRIIIATGALEVDGAEPEKTIRAVTAKAMLDQFAVNAMGPALVLRHAERLLTRKGRSLCTVLSARVGSIGDNRLGGWVSYRAAKAALNQILRTTAIELARTRPEGICVALHPGTVITPFTQKYLGKHPALPARDAAANLIRVMDGLVPSDTGKFLDWAGKEIPW